MLIGESLIIGTHGKREGNGLHTVGDMAACVDVEQRAALKVLTAAFHDAVDKMRNGYLLIAHDRNVTGDGREAGQRGVYGIGATSLHKSVQRELSAVEFGVDAVILGDQRVNLTEHTDIFVAAVDLCAAAGVVRRVIGAGLITNALCTDIGKHGLDNALEREEGRTGTVGAEREVLRLYRKTVLAAETVGPAYLVELDSLIAEVVVAGENFEHGRQSCRAHDGGVLAKWVEYPEACSSRVIGCPA